MGDRSPTEQYRIGNFTVKLKSNNQQKNKREYSHEKNIFKNFHRSGDNRYNDRYYKDNNNFSNKRNNYDYDNRREQYYKNHRNKSSSNSRSQSRHKYTHHKNHNSRSRSHSNKHNYKTNNNHPETNYIKPTSNNNTQLNQNIKTNNTNQNNTNNNNNINNNLNNMSNMNNNQMFMNMSQFNQNYINNYNEFLQKLYQAQNQNNINNNNNNTQNNNSNKIFVPIGIPMNYFFNPNFNKNFTQNTNNNNNTTNNNIPDKNQNKSSNQNKKEEPSNTILITDLDTNINKDTLEEIFRDKCLQLQISMPIDIRLIEALNVAYIIFPSVTSCIAVYKSLLNQKILINGKYFPIQFAPNLTQNYGNNRDTMTYVTQISSNSSLTRSMETTVHEDWYCVYCDSKNFSRRTVCFKCQKPKSINSRVVPVIKQKKIILGANGEILPNNSIIVQGKQIQYSNEGEVFIISKIYNYIFLIF